MAAPGVVDLAAAQGPLVKVTTAAVIADSLQRAGAEALALLVGMQPHQLLAVLAAQDWHPAYLAPRSLTLAAVADLMLLEVLVAGALVAHLARRELTELPTVAVVAAAADPA